MAISRGKIPLGLTEDHERLLRDITITPDHPGPILRDFQTLLDYIGSAGVPAGGQHHLLPLGILPTLNQHMSWPIKVDLERPQLRSYPNLQGLHLLSRASGLVIVQCAGSKARLAVDASLLASWTHLNPTEQYFSLLSVWLDHARKEILGARAGLDEAFIDYAARVWCWIPENGQQYSVNERRSSNAIVFADPDRYTIVLMALFGLLEIEQGKPIAGCAWIPTSIRRRPFGEAMFAALAPRIRRFTSMDRWVGDLAEGSTGGKKKSGSKNAMAEDDATAALESSDDGRIRFNSFHSIFARYFPSLKDSLAIDVGQAGEGLFIFRVSLRQGMWRRIAAPAQSTLEDLAEAIRASVKFDDDHLWSFRFKDRFGNTVEIRHPEARFQQEGEELGADQVQVAQLPIAPGESMVFLYDYGDSWEFTVLLESVDPPAPRQRKPKLIEKKGRSPEQYPDWNG